MKRRHVEIAAETAASPETVFALLADGTTWTKWSPIESFELEQAGDPPPEGPGAIRVFRMGKTTGRDLILELVPNQRMKYASLSGLPVRDYVGEVTLSRTPAGGTAIDWRSSFFAKVPGTGRLLQRGLRKFLGQCAHGLAEYAPTVSETRA